MKGFEMTEEKIDQMKVAEEFSKRYQELCKELGFQIIPVPQLAQSKDMGDYRIVVSLQVVPIKEEG
jgi:hypothetical protein